MKKVLIKILGVLLIGFILYWEYLYIEHSKVQKHIEDVDKALKECYEQVKKDVKINRLGVPEFIEFQEYDSANVTKNVNGEAIVEFWVKSISSKQFETKYDSIKFIYWMNDKGKYKFISTN